MTSIEPSYASRSAYPRLVLLALGLFVVGTNAFVIAGLLPDIAKSLGVSASTVSYSITFYSILVAVASPIVAIVIPRWSRTALMASGLVLISVGTVIAAASVSIEVFTAGRVVAALGGAALVPAATAAAAAIVPPERRGRAIAFVALGFTGATALGSPLGTAIGAVGGWEVPLYGVAGLALLLAILIALVVRDVPVGAPIRFAQRFAPLRDVRVVMTLAATFFLLAGFNVVYIFSSAVTTKSTGGDGALLALLLLIVGLAGTVGNVVTGPLTDRLGSRRTASGFMAIQFLALVALPIAAGNFAATAVVFAIWGLVAFAAVPPIQHRLVTIDPATSAVAISWYTTAMYVGIAVAPPLGAAALGLGVTPLIPIFGAVATGVALALFLVGHRSPVSNVVPVSAA